jgi:putative acetyltransferase
MPDDIPWLAATSVAAYRDYFAPLLPHLDLRGFDEGHFTARFGRSLGKVRIACEGDRPLGFTMVTDGNIDMFFVADGLRRGGVGTLMLEDAEKHGAETLECFAANIAARRFYEKHGWTLADSYSRPFGGAPCEFVRYTRPG